MKKLVAILFAVAFLFLLTVRVIYPIPLTHEAAVTVLVKESAYEPFYSSRIFSAEAKRDWVRAQMSGTASELRQEEKLTAYINELYRVRALHAKAFSEKYTLFTRLGLI